MDILSKPLKPDQPVSFSDLKCPLCKRALADAEYQSAIDELRKRESVSYEGKVKEITEQFQKKLQIANNDHLTEIERVKQSNSAQTKLLEENLKVTYQEQVNILKKTYEEINQDNRRQFELAETKLEEASRKELEEKERRIKELVEGQAHFREVAVTEATAQSKAELDRLQLQVRERDVQLRRLEQDIEGLKKQASQSQSELKGEAGELDLYERLTSAFSADRISRQKRGTSSGDLIQKIRTTSGEVITPLVYDNKESDAVTRQDIEKAKSYKKIHNTNYVIVVSRNLPKKEIPNGLLGEKDGVLICHPSIVVEVASQLRMALIELERRTESREHRESKESKLFDYIISQDFHQGILELSKIHEMLASIQLKEEKQHLTLWKERKRTVEKLVSTATAIETDIDSIIGSAKPVPKRLVNKQELLS